MQVDSHRERAFPSTLLSALGLVPLDTRQQSRRPSRHRWELERGDLIGREAKAIVHGIGWGTVKPLRPARFPELGRTFDERLDQEVFRPAHVLHDESNRHALRVRTPGEFLRGQAIERLHEGCGMLL